MNVNSKSELLFLKQFGFSSKLLESIFLSEYSPITAIFDANSPERFYIDSYLTEKDSRLSLLYSEYIIFKEELFKKDDLFKKNGLNKIYFKYDKNLVTELIPEEIMPLFMYSKGNIGLLDSNRKRVAIVGTRKPTKTAVGDTIAICKNFVAKNYVIVSGLAEGIDTFAHTATLSCKGDTIAVLPTNFNTIYPKMNVKLASTILREGLLISAIGPAENTFKTSFLERNQYVASISDIVFVIETNIRSGTMNTIRNANKLGKKILYLRQADDSINEILKDMGGELFEF